MVDLKIGTVLVCIKERYILTRKVTTIGKKYIIKKENGKSFSIIDDEDDHLYFFYYIGSPTYWKDFFFRFTRIKKKTVKKKLIQ